MLFKDFEFKAINPNKYELVKWNITNVGRRNCFVIGCIEYNSKESCWEFVGCGLRYQKYYEDGLNEFVLKYTELLDLQKKYRDKEMDEFYENY